MSQRDGALSFRPLFFSVVLAVSGCQSVGGIQKPIVDAGSEPPTVDGTLQQLSLSLSRINVLVPSDLLLAEPAGHWDSLPPKDSAGHYPAAVQKALDVLAYSQCFAINPKDGKIDQDLQRRNPLVPTSTGPLQITVQGQLSLGGTLTVSLTPSIAGTATRQTQQQIMLPVTLVSLSNLPSFYLGQQLTNIQYVTLVPTFKAKDPVRAALEERQVQDYVADDTETASRLRLVTTEALAEFENTTTRVNWCSGKERGGAVVVGGAALF